jgi:glycosyltransferase involved in cell wall biosynthesis
MAEVASAVVVASRHELRLLAACGSRGGEVVHVVPLPVPRLAPSPAVERGTEPRAVAVLGFLYPGKGHEQVLDALDGLPSGVGLLALGRPSDGHEDLVEDLERRARDRGRTLEVTGYVPDEQLPGLLRSAVVPVAPHEHLSASGSINTWIGAGRRPLVPRSDYVLELLDRSPDCVRVYDELPAALRQVWEEPGLSWADGPGRPTLAETVRDLRAVLERVQG